MELFNSVVDRLQAAFPVNRVVVLLTPIVFVPTAAWISAYVAKHFPGLPHFDSTQLTVVMGIGAASALVAAYRWIDGFQKHEERVFYGNGVPGADNQLEIAEIEAEAKKVIALIEAGHLPADVAHLLNGPSEAAGTPVAVPAPQPAAVPTSLPPRPPTAA